MAADQSDSTPATAAATTPIYVVTVPHKGGEKTVYEGTSRRSARIFKGRNVMAQSWRYLTTQREAFDV